ncbi:unnamed protein product [Alopecurus aequalis]
MHSLPVDVLGCLPPQSLAACRCVSKAWRDLVNGRDTLRLSLLPAKVAGLFLLLSSTLGFEFFARPTAGPAIPGKLEYLPNEPVHQLVAGVRSHWNGILAFPGVVANPATRQWVRLPSPPPCPEISSELFWEHLAFDPTVSRHYEVFLTPKVPTEKFVHDQSEISHDSIYDGENYNADENNCLDDDFTLHYSVYDGENYGEYSEDRDSCVYYEPAEDRAISSDDEEDEHCEVPLQFEWDSDNDNIIDSTTDVVDKGSSEDVAFLGFHPSKEIVFLHVSSTRGVAYHLNGAKVQDLGKLVFSDPGYVRQSFVYTPCRMTLL